MKRMMLVPALVVLGACGGSVPGDRDATTMAGLTPCGADKVQDLLGQPVAGLRDRFADTARIIPHGGAMTEDYRPERLNVNLDQAGLIARIWCG